MGAFAVGTLVTGLATGFGVDVLAAGLATGVLVAEAVDGFGASGVFATDVATGRGAAAGLATGAGERVIGAGAAMASIASPGFGLGSLPQSQIWPWTRR